MNVDEAVRGHVPPLWFWALPGIDRIRAFDQSQLPSSPIPRLLGIRAGHVGPGSGTWVMPAAGWSSITTGELEISMLAETAVTGVAMTTLTPGLDVEPVSVRRHRGRHGWRRVLCPLRFPGARARLCPGASRYRHPGRHTHRRMQAARRLHGLSRRGLTGPGDVLVSSTVKDIVVGSDARFEDRGQHSLKGMPGEWRLFSLAD